MSETVDWNAQTIAEFRANQGRVGGNFEGAPLVLVHRTQLRPRISSPCPGSDGPRWAKRHVS